MFIDYVTLMIINMLAGHVILAYYIYKGLDDENPRHWSPGFGIVGLIALITGLHMIFTWPLPSSYNITHGEMSVFFGIIFLATSFALYNKLDLFTIAIYSLFAGAASVIIGARIIISDMTKGPVMSGLGFILSGLCGVFSLPTYLLRNNKKIRIVGALGLLAAGAIWALIGYVSYYDHLESFAKWVPLTMK